jgi:hypothetical protein
MTILDPIQPHAPDTRPQASHDTGGNGSGSGGGLLSRLFGKGKATTLALHLPGKHSQASHGRGGGGGGSSTAAPRDPISAQHFNDRIEVETATPAADMADLTRSIFGEPLTAEQVARRVGAPDGSHVDVNREQDWLEVMATHPMIKKFYYVQFVANPTPGSPANVTLNSLYLRPGANPPPGLGTRMVARLAERNPASAISLRAAGAGPGNERPEPRANGYYTWPRLGFNGPIPEREGATLPARFRSAPDVRTLMATPQGREAWKQYGGQAALTLDAPGRRILNRYLEEKGIALAARPRPGPAPSDGDPDGVDGEALTKDDERLLDRIWADVLGPTRAADGDGDGTVKLVTSAIEKRRRVFRRYALGQDDVEKLAKEIATLRVAAYEGRLQNIIDGIGLNQEAHLYEPAILRRIARESRDVALGVINTANTSLRNFINNQPVGTTQRQMAAMTRQWQADRQQWKARQIAQNEGLIGRHQADADVLKRNGLTPQVKVVPSVSAEKLCADAIARGWMRPSDVGFSLPLHVNCIHSFAYRQSFEDMVKGKDKLWLGEDVSIKATDVSLHLPGRHSQASHGRGGSGGGGGGDEAAAPSAAAVAAFESMPDEKPTGPAAKKWLKEHQALYEQDASFRALADATALYTQGSYGPLREATRLAAGGEPTGAYEHGLKNGHLLGKATHPLAKDPKGFFKGQEANKNGDYTIMQTGSLLNQTLARTTPLDQPLYRGAPIGSYHFKEMGKLKPGDPFDLHELTSFTTSRTLGDQFSMGAASGQRRKGTPEYTLVIEVQPGARGLRAAALSPYAQNEVMTSGAFRVTRVEQVENQNVLVSRSRTEPFGTVRVTVEQEGVWTE